MSRNEAKLVFKSYNDEIDYYKKRCNEYREYINNMATQISIYEFICKICHEIYDENDDSKMCRCNECYAYQCDEPICLDCLTSDQLKKMKICKDCNKYFCEDCINIENHDCT